MRLLQYYVCLVKELQFDVVLVDPPWEEYHHRDPSLGGDFWTYEQLVCY